MIGTVETDAQGIAGLTLDEFEYRNAYNIALRVQLEPEMKQYVDEDRFDVFDQPGSFGSLTTSVYAGAEYLLLRCTAVTSGMSHVLQYSGAVHDLWARLAADVGSTIAYVDLEGDSGLQVYPSNWIISLPDAETLAFVHDDQKPFDEGHFSVDLAAAFLIATSPDSHPPG